MKIMRWLYPNASGQVPTILMSICLLSLGVGLLNLGVGIVGNLAGLFSHSAAITMLKFNVLLLASALSSAVLLFDIDRGPREHDQA